MKNKCIFKNEQDLEKVTRTITSLISKAVGEALVYENFEYPCEISVTFTDNMKIRELNKSFRGKDKATDVLSFPMYDFSEEQPIRTEHPIPLGDIVISLERAREQCLEYGHSFEREVAFLAVHSTLHLLGYDHEVSDAADAEMREKQREIMKRLGLEVENKSCRQEGQK